MLIRFDPFREMERAAGTWWNGRAPGLPMDAYRRGDEFIVHFDLPGVDPSSIDLTVEKNVLTVRAQRQWPMDDVEKIAIQERPQGNFTRQLFLGDQLDADGLAASYEHGVLTLTIPMVEQAKPRKVEITAGSGQTAIGAGHSEP
ncbi:MAG TPA: Hsp20/alpha crystallin family protein [Acidimicrobiia bacterium]|nr:Hsp20/alpha crystallin family protein [Acidimicrobiia bacterium]